jgi:hypothetical protein
MSSAVILKLPLSDLHQADSHVDKSIVSCSLRSGERLELIDHSPALDLLVRKYFGANLIDMIWKYCGICMFSLDKSVL